jgi:hypothetical protein
MKLWIDDRRPAPKQENKWPDSREWLWVKSVKEAIATIQAVEFFSFLCGDEIELIDIDHDAGDFACDGGDYIRILDWLEETGRNYPIRIHSANAVGIENMRRIIERNGWKEIK